MVLPAAAMAIAFGPHLPDADWMPIATLVAMQPSLQQSALVTAQRVATSPRCRARSPARLSSALGHVVMADRVPPLMVPLRGPRRGVAQRWWE